MQCPSNLVSTATVLWTYLCVEVWTIHPAWTHKDTHTPVSHALPQASENLRTSACNISSLFPAAFVYVLIYRSRVLTATPLPSPPPSRSVLKRISILEECSSLGTISDKCPFLSNCKIERPLYYIFTHTSPLRNLQLWDSNRCRDQLQFSRIYL